MLKYLLLFALTSNCVADTLVIDHFPKNGPLPGRVPEIGNAWSGNEEIKVHNSFVLLPNQLARTQTDFAVQRETRLYAGLTVRLTQAPPAVRNCIFAFQSSGESVGRLYVVPGKTRFTYRVGIANGSASPVLWSEPLLLHRAYRMVVGFTESTSYDQTSLWINPTQQTSKSVIDSPTSLVDRVDGIVLQSGDPFNARFQGTAAQVQSVYVGTDFHQAAAPGEDNFQQFEGTYQGIDSVSHAGQPIYRGLLTFIFTGPSIVERSFMRGNAGVTTDTTFSFDSKTHTWIAVGQTDRFHSYYYTGTYSFGPEGLRLEEDRMFPEFTPASSRIGFRPDGSLRIKTWSPGFSSTWIGSKLD